MVDFFKNHLKSKLGFNIVELLTAVGITGVLSTVGVKSYISQVNKARSAEAQHSLSTMFKAQKQFKTEWGTYHENLVVVGFTPEENLYYDVGFHTSASLSDTDGELESFPTPTLLTVRECTNAKQICDGTCATSSSGLLDSSYFDSCSDVEGDLYLKDGAGTSASKAGESSFKATATAKIRDNDDVWTIDQSKVIVHEVDGTE